MRLRQVQAISRCTTCRWRGSNTLALQHKKGGLKARRIRLKEITEKFPGFCL